MRVNDPESPGVTRARRLAECDMILRGPKAIWAPRPLFCGAAIETAGELLGHDSRVFKASFSPVNDALLATCSEDATCRLWDVSRCEQLYELQHADAIYSAKFSPNGSFLVTAGCDGKIILWDLKRLALDATPGTVRSTLSVTCEDAAAVQTIALGQEAFGAHFLDDSTVACAIDDKVVLWDVETARPTMAKTVSSETQHVFGGLERNPDATPWVFALEHHKGSNLIAIGVSDATIRLLDSGLNEHVVFKGHARDVACLRFRADGAELLSGSGDNMAAAWDLKTLQVRLVLKGHTGSVHDCCYWPVKPGHDPREICTVSMDHTMKFWDMDSGECSSTVGPDVTAKLCLAPNQTLMGVAVSGGENKTNTGNDFRVNLLSKQPGGRDRLMTYAADHAIRFDTGGLGRDKDGAGFDRRGGVGVKVEPSPPAGTGSSKKKNRKKAKGKGKGKGQHIPEETGQSVTEAEQESHVKDPVPEDRAGVPEDRAGVPEDRAAAQAVAASPTGRRIHAVESDKESGDHEDTADLELIGQSLSNMSDLKGQGELQAKKAPCLSDTPVAAFDNRHAAEASPDLSDASGGVVAAEEVPGGCGLSTSMDAVADSRDVPQWLQVVMKPDEIAQLSFTMGQQRVDQADLEFFDDEALKEAGIGSAISRAKMLRQIRDHFLG
jgi:WD40 repeat protein